MLIVGGPGLSVNRNDKTHVDRGAPLESLAAELTLAAYSVALRARTEGTWHDLELDLWPAVVDRTTAWERELPRRHDGVGWAATGV
jgi:hypothetical protein